MNRHQITRAATVVVFVVVVVVAVVRFFPDTSRTQRPEAATGELTVDRAIAVAGVEPVTVRGFVFLGPGPMPLRLCTGVEKLEVPECLGPYITLEGVNEASFDLRPVKKDANPHRYQRESVALLGVLTGTEMRVQQVLQ